ncbi:FecCD family ABC transporter permease [Labrys monachus]|uniref:Iron complex transport system permease protein n=1 Tax=Labrys monachus TaxID=217067 RepID=A0ABU0FAD3_9HYPH|nr:iron ABC transporter permease [Labrys monachus]MDQ0391579.1 iron complex transport system permease protein [Labrys monachus]
MSFVHAVAQPLAHAATPRRRECLVLAVLGALLAAALAAGLAFGGVHIPPSAWLTAATGGHDLHSGILVGIRLPRVLLGGLVGAGLALSGASMQALFRNPLADPGLTGSASGGILAVVAGIVLLSRADGGAGAGWGLYTLPAVAALACCLTTVLTYRLARDAGGHVGIASLLLAGIGINALAMAAVGLFVTIADDGQLRSIQFWMMGSLAGADWVAVAGTLPALLAASLLLVRRTRALDAYTLGESEAFLAGVDTAALKRGVIAATALAIGAAVAFTGLIGFVGLVAPHCARFLGGQRYSFVLPASGLIGAALVILADAVARVAISPAELPIGLVTSLLGAPVFIALLRRGQRP